MNGAGNANSIQFYLIISPKAVYTRKNDSTKLEVSFLPLMQKKIAEGVTKVNSIHRIKTNYIKKALEVRTVKRKSCRNLIYYLSKNSLYSSKYLYFLCWS